jgi:hypothetical protein
MATYLPADRPSRADQSSATSTHRRCRAEMSDDLCDPEGRLIDWLLGFTLDTRGGQHVEIPVLPASPDRLVMTLSVGA